MPPMYLPSYVVKEHILHCSSTLAKKQQHSSRQGYDPWTAIASVTRWLDLLNNGNLQE